MRGARGWRLRRFWGEIPGSAQVEAGFRNISTLEVLMVGTVGRRPWPRIDDDIRIDGAITQWPVFSTFDIHIDGAVPSVAPTRLHADRFLMGSLYYTAELLSIIKFTFRHDFQHHHVTIPYVTALAIRASHCF